jgi:hypothetical protein
MFEYGGKTTFEWLPKKVTEDGRTVTMDRSHCYSMYLAKR